MNLGTVASPAVTPQAFPTLESLSTAFRSGAVKAGDDIAVNGRIWDTSGPLGEVRLTSDQTYETIRLNGPQGVIDALEAVSKDHSGTPVTVNGTFVGTDFSGALIDVKHVQIPAIVS